jgi:selenocysteine-specific elongation factor
VAVNLVGLDRADVPRGTLLGRPGAWRETRQALVSLRRARYVDAGLTDRGAYHLHLGSGSWPIRLRLLDDDAAMIRIDSPVPLAAGDRFVLRDVGRRWVAGGGIVLDPAPPARRRTALSARDRLQPVATGPSDDRATALLAIRGLADLDELAADSDGGVPAGGVTVGRIAVDPDRLASMEADAVGLVEAYHRDNPLRPGMPTASLSSRLDVPMAVIEAMVDGSPQLVDGGSTVASAGFGGGWGEAEEQEWRRAKAELEAAGAAAPRASTLHLDDELLHALLRDGRLIRVADDLVYLTEQLDALEASLRRLPDGFTVAEFRDAAGLSRRQAVPLLEWFDRAGVTVRAGDGRTVRPPRPGPRSPDDAPTR